MRLIEPVISRLGQEVGTPRFLAVGGGKGGVGKTCVSVNLSVHIAQKGWRVVLVDADLSCSNVETVLGARTERSLDEFFLGKGRKALHPLVCETRYANLRIVPGATGLLDVANPKYQQKVALIRELRQIDADLIVIDLDAGAHLNTLDFFLITDANGILVINPEKTSIDNAFKFMRASLFRKIERFYQSPEVGVLLKRSESLREFVDAVGASELFNEETREQLCVELIALAASVKPRIVVNRARNPYEAQIASNILAKWLRQHLMVDPEYLGFLYYDRCVEEAVNAGTPFVVSNPKLKISECISDIANRLGYF